MVGTISMQLMRCSWIVCRTARGSKVGWIRIVPCFIKVGRTIAEPAWLSGAQESTRGADSRGGEGEVCDHRTEVIGHPPQALLAA